MRKRILLAVLLLGVGYAAGWVSNNARGRSARAAEQLPPNERHVFVDRPDPSSPTGRVTARLIVRRVTGGPEGTTEHNPPVPTRAEPGGGLGLVIGPDDWVLSIGQRCYVLSAR